MPLSELAALGAALCWAITGTLAVDAVRVVGPFWFNMLRQGAVVVLLAALVTATARWQVLTPPQLMALAASGAVGIFIGDTVLFAAVGRLGPRRAGALFALNAPMAAVLGWLLLGERLGAQASLGVVATAAGVALAVLGRARADAHAVEQMRGALWAGVAFGLLAALGQAAGALLARPVMAAGVDPFLASLARVAASLALMLAVLPRAPAVPEGIGSRRVLGIVLLTALVGLITGMTLLLYALQSGKVGIISTLSATTPVMILPLLWLRTGQRPTLASVAGAVVAVAGVALIFLR